MAQVDVLFEGYTAGGVDGQRVASTVGLIRDEAVVVVVDPGLVPSPAAILDPLAALGLPAEAVTDVVFSHHHPDHTLNAALFPKARYHDFWAVYEDDLWTTRLLANEPDGWSLGSSIRLLYTPGHSTEDLSTIVDTDRGVIVCTHAWWTPHGPATD